jgi:hypothetical protein
MLCFENYHFRSEMSYRSSAAVRTDQGNSYPDKLVLRDQSRVQSSNLYACRVPQLWTRKVQCGWRRERGWLCSEVSRQHHRAAASTPLARRRPVMPPKQPAFVRTALPFLVMMGLGSWGLSQFLKLPTQMKDENRRRKKAGHARFSLEQENEVRGRCPLLRV